MHVQVSSLRGVRSCHHLLAFLCDTCSILSLAVCINVHTHSLSGSANAHTGEAVADAATSGSSKFFLGTDSAPHPKGAKVRAELCCHVSCVLCVATICRSCTSLALSTEVKKHTKHLSSYLCTPIQESACGCAGMYSAPISLGLYATAFEAAGRLPNLEGFASIHGPSFYGMPRNEVRERV